MHARVTRYEVKLDQVEEADRILEQIRPEVMNIPGLKEYVSLRSDDGTKRIAITVYETQQHADNAIPRALRLWARLTKVMAATPESGAYSVTTRQVAD